MADEPIVVMEGDNLTFFRSRVAAEQYLEAIDVEEGVYTGAFDAEGHALKLRVVEVEEKGLFGLGKVPVACVRIEEDALGSRIDDAREALVAFLRRVDPGASMDPATPIREIVRAAAGKYAVC